MTFQNFFKTTVFQTLHDFVSFPGLTVIHVYFHDFLGFLPKSRHIVSNPQTPRSKATLKPIGYLVIFILTRIHATRKWHSKSSTTIAHEQTQLSATDSRRVCLINARVFSDRVLMQERPGTNI